MTEIEFIYSIRGKRCGAQWYPRPDRVTIFLNNIPNPESDFEEFIASMIALELHELGHIKGFRGGCKGCKGKCWYCQLTSLIGESFEFGELFNWRYETRYLNQYAKQNNKSGKSWKETQQRN